MPSLFSPESPLGQEVQRILIEQREGLTVSSIRRALRLRGKHVEERNLRELLNHPSVFTAFSGDRYRLAGSFLPTFNPVDPRAYGSMVPNGEQPWLHNLPNALENYVVLDLETTGLDPKRDRIVQIVAIRVEDGYPIAARNYYVNPAPVQIPLTVRLKLGLDRLPEVERAINQGPTIEKIARELREFIGDLPLVAHNARFDNEFLRASLGEFPNTIIDTMELALLAYPNLSNHRLETLINTLGVEPGEASAIWSSAFAGTATAPIDLSTLHNAVTDTCFLTIVYRHLLAHLSDSERQNRSILRWLLPEAFGEIWRGTAQWHEAFVEALQRPPTLAREQSRYVSVGNIDSIESLLTQYRDNRAFDSRPSQNVMAELAHEALANDRFKMIEAPTGTGKSIAYLVAAVKKAFDSGERVVLSTAYKNLQEQLLGEIAHLREATRLPLRVQVLKGTSNYLCRTRLGRSILELSPGTSLAERYVLAYLYNWSLGTDGGTLDELSFWCLQTFGIARRIVSDVAAIDGCKSERCLEYQCPLLTATERAKTAHLIVVNHAFWLAEPKRLPEFHYLIVDEAHTLEDIATSAFTQEVSRESLESLLNRLLDRQTGRGILPRFLAQYGSEATTHAARQLFAALDRIATLIIDFGHHLDSFIRGCEGHFDPRYGASMRLEAPPARTEPTRWPGVDNARKQLFALHLPDLIGLLGQLRDKHTALGPVRDDLDVIIEGLSAQVQLQDDIIRVRNRRQVYWIEVTATAESDAPDNDADSSANRRDISYWGFKTAPVSVADILGEYYQRLRGALFVSATLSIRGGDFSFFVDRLGLGEWLGAQDIHTITGGLDYARNAFLGLANYLEYAPTQRTMQSFQEELAKELGLLLRFTDGRSLVLFTARTRMEAVYRQCVNALAEHGIPVYQQHAGGSRRQLQEEFTARSEAVLFGLRSFWEGVDVPGESLSFVIMEKLPFPFLFDPVFKARREEVLRNGRHEFHDFIFPLMAIQFKQGFGRLLRHDTDRGAVLLMDKRIHRKEYKYDLLGSLPGFIPRDEQIERSRRSFYEALINTLPTLIDAGAKGDFLDALPAELTLDFVERLAAFQLPSRIRDDEYDGMRPLLMAALRELFHFSDFRSPEQEETIRTMLTGHDVLALLPTGAGKSLCFQLTALLREGITLVFSPLIALMRDQVQSLNARGIEIVSAIYSGQPADEREETLARMRSGKVRLVYISPERIRDPQLVQTIRATHVTQVVVDEAHCVAMWGPSFRPDFLYLTRLFDHLPDHPPIAAFTATATPEIRSEIIRSLELRNPRQIVASFDRPELRFVVYNAHSRYNPIRSRNDRFAVLMKVLHAADRNRESVLIYVATTVEADLFARRLRAAGYDARAYHGRMTTADRDSVQEMFMDDHVNIVVCTKAFGMGIDKSDIRYVIHCHMPGDLESYYQEAGRAGRDGKESFCILLYHRSDRDVHDYFIESGLPDEELLHETLSYLRSTPGEVVYLNNEALITRLGIDEVKLRVSLHLLENTGFIERGADFTLRGSLTLIEDREDIFTHLVSLDARDAALFDRVALALAWPTHRRVEVDLLEAAKSGEVGPEIIETLLIRLAITGLVLYRPWEKGSKVTKQARLLTEETYTNAIEASEHLSRLTKKLGQMVAYAESTERDGCRRTTILHYFGQTSTRTNCGTCDRCAPEYVYPWSHTLSRDVGRFSDYFDPAFTLLEVIKWNLDRAAGGSNPFGTNTLIHALLGNAYILGRSQPNPDIRRRRLETLRSCPYWGIFDALPNGDEALRQHLERLRREGYIGDGLSEFEDGSTRHQYTFPELLSKGIDQLTQGELLQW